MWLTIASSPQPTVRSLSARPLQTHVRTLRLLGWEVLSAFQMEGRPVLRRSSLPVSCPIFFHGFRLTRPPNTALLPGRCWLRWPFFGSCLACSRLGMPPFMSYSAQIIPRPSLLEGTYLRTGHVPVPTSILPPAGNCPHICASGFCPRFS